MPKKTTPLTDIKVKATKPQTINIKLFDGGGLFLLIKPNGSKLWRLKYRFGGTEKLIDLGTYPQTTLADARQRRTKARGAAPMGRRTVPGHLRRQNEKRLFQGRLTNGSQ